MSSANNLLTPNYQQQQQQANGSSPFSRRKRVSMDEDNILGSTAVFSDLGSSTNNLNINNTTSNNNTAHSNTHTGHSHATVASTSAPSRRSAAPTAPLQQHVDPHAPRIGGAADNNNKTINHTNGTPTAPSSSSLSLSSSSPARPRANSSTALPLKGLGGAISSQPQPAGGHSQGVLRFSGRGGGGGGSGHAPSTFKFPVDLEEHSSGSSQKRRLGGGGGGSALSSTYNARMTLPNLDDSDDGDDNGYDQLAQTTNDFKSSRVGAVGGDRSVSHAHSDASSVPFTGYTAAGGGGSASSPNPYHNQNDSSNAHNSNSFNYQQYRKQSAVSVASTAATIAFSESELRYFKKIFDTFDADKSGSLGFVEVRALCRHLGVEISDDELRDSIDEIDDNGNGLLEFDEFTQWLAEMGGGANSNAHDNHSFGERSASHHSSHHHQGGGGGARNNSVSSSNGGGGGGDNWAILKSRIRAKGANPLTNQQIETFKEVFHHFDTNNSGTIDREELKGVFVAMGRVDVTDDEVDEIMAEVDDDDSGEIDFDEFLMLMCLGYSKGGGMGEDGSQSIEEYIRNAIEVYDPHRTDTISPEDLKEVIMSMCGLAGMEEAEAEGIVALCPRDDHNRVVYTQWASLWDACQGALGS